MAKVLLITKWNDITKVVEKYLEFDSKKEAKDYVDGYDIEKNFPNYIIANKPKKSGMYIVDEENKTLKPNVQISESDLYVEGMRRLVDDVTLDLGKHGKQTFEMKNENFDWWKEVLLYAIALKATNDETEIGIQTRSSYIVMKPEEVIETLKKVLAHRQNIFTAFFTMRKDGIPEDYTKDKHWK